MCGYIVRPACCKYFSTINHLAKTDTVHSYLFTSSISFYTFLKPNKHYHNDYQTQFYILTVVTYLFVASTPIFIDLAVVKVYEIKCSGK